MNAYIFEAARDSGLTDCHKSVLKSRLAAICGSGNIQFHGDETAVFTPEDCALLIAGNLPATPEGLDDVLPYMRAMRWFSDSLAGFGIAAPDDFNDTEWQPHISTLNSLRIVTVPDARSADILRRAGVRTAISTCADLGYLCTASPVTGTREPERPVRLANDRLGVVLSVLQEAPFVLTGHDDLAARECRAIGYPMISSVDEAWSERVALRELLREKRGDRVRLAKRNIDLLQIAVSKIPGKTRIPSDSGRQTLLVWAAPDEYWEEAQPLLNEIGPGFDCLVPSSSRLSPMGCRKLMPLPPGTLMHWSMLPADLKEQIENRYEHAVVCHAYASNGKTHLADVATRTGRRRWEYRLWTHSCESYS